MGLLSPGQGMALWQSAPLGREEQWVLGNHIAPIPDPLVFPPLQHLGTMWPAYEALQISTHQSSPDPETHRLG